MGVFLLCDLHARRWAYVFAGMEIDGWSWFFCVLFLGGSSFLQMGCRMGFVGIHAKIVRGQLWSRGGRGRDEIETEGEIFLLLP